jgi:hypothetical protein
MAGLEPVDIAAIRDELVGLLLQAGGPIRSISDTGEPDEIIPGLYWPHIRESLKRLKAILPEDPDLADCDILMRSELRRVSSFVIGLWEDNHFDDMPVKAQPGEPESEAPEWAHWPFELGQRTVQVIRYHLRNFPEPDRSSTDSPGTGSDAISQLGSDQPDESQMPATQTITREVTDCQSRAIAYFLSEAKKRPPSEITKAEIIEKLGCAESTLSKGRALTLHALMEAHKSQSSAGTTRKGSKDAGGNLEALD